MSNEAKGPYEVVIEGDEFEVQGPSFIASSWMSMPEAERVCQDLNAAYLAGQQDKLPPDPHITDQEQYLEAKSKRFEARTEGESTAEVERAMKGEPSPSIDRIMEVVERWNYSPHVHLFGDDERKFSERKLNDLRTRLTSLFNGEG